MEISSKKPVSVLREVIPSTKKKAIDPRFDRAYGHFNSDLFTKSYDFLGEMQKNEHEELRKALRNEKDEYKRSSMKKTLERFKSMQKTKEKMEQRKRVIREHRKLESKLVEQGKNPYFLKKGDIKKLELAEEYEKVKKRLGDGADLDKFIEKRRKRKASKQKRFIPNEDRGDY